MDQTGKEGEIFLGTTEISTKLGHASKFVTYKLHDTLAKEKNVNESAFNRCAEPSYIKYAEIITKIKKLGGTTKLPDKLSLAEIKELDSTTELPVK